MVSGRRRRRALRRIDPVSVLKTSLLLYSALALTFGTAFLILWNVARGSGLITRIENGIKNSGGLASFEIDSMLVAKVSIGFLVLSVLVGSAANVLAAVLYNLSADVVGGVQLIVLEEVPTPNKAVSKPAAQETKKVAAGAKHTEA